MEKKWLLRINGDDWKKNIRPKVFSRDNYTCQGCLEKKAQVVHHTTYDHIGKEFMFELISLCFECHERIHGKNNSDQL